MKKLFIGCPLHNGTCDAFRTGYGNLILKGVPGWELRWYEYGGGGITLARNRMAAEAIRRGFDVLLFVSGDIGFHENDMPGAISRILAHFDRPEVSCAGGVYLFKRYPLQIIVSQDQAREVDEHGLIEVNRTGTDFMAIRVSALNEVIQKWQGISEKLYAAQVPLSYQAESGTEWNLFGQAPAFAEDGETVIFLPEDFYWCRLAREAGFKIHIDTQIRLQHWGRFNFDANGVNGIEEALKTPNPEFHHATAP